MYYYHSHLLRTISRWEGPKGVKADGGGSIRGQGRIGKMLLHHAASNREAAGEILTCLSALAASLASRINAGGIANMCLAFCTTSETAAGAACEIPTIIMHIINII